jgi:LAO/AO transport system kinase
MDEQSKSRSEQNAIQRIRRRSADVNPRQLLNGLLHGNTADLAHAITLSESQRPTDIELSSDLLQQALPYTGKAMRVGITGVPGVGKSTFIDAFGNYLTSLGKKVAVLAIDPTSQISHGSILGDKTRMEKLSIDKNAFIRPSPSALSLGGVARKTREAIILCEAAGYDIILVETVGVGQSETAVHGMTDFFLLLMLAGAGDQLQGIKRGIMEMCDGMLITKSDGDNIKKANYAKAEYGSALHLFPARPDGWIPRVEVCSAINGTGVEDAWNLISGYETWMKERNLFAIKRQEQDIGWMHETIKEHLLDSFYLLSQTKVMISEQEEMIRTNKTTPFRAAEHLLKMVKFNS